MPARLRLAAHRIPGTWYRVRAASPLRFTWNRARTLPPPRTPSTAPTRPSPPNVTTPGPRCRRLGQTLAPPRPALPTTRQTRVQPTCLPPLSSPGLEPHYAHMHRDSPSARCLARRQGRGEHLAVRSRWITAHARVRTRPTRSTRTRGRRPPAEPAITDVRARRLDTTWIFPEAIARLTCGDARPLAAPVTTQERASALRGGAPRHRPGWRANGCAHTPRPHNPTHAVPTPQPAHAAPA